MKRILSLALALVLLAIPLSACKNNKENPESTEAPTSENAVTYADKLPADLNFENQEVSILYNNFYGASDIIQEKELEGNVEGDTVASSVYRRNRAVENRLGVVLVFDQSMEETPYEYSTLVEQLWFSSDTTYDLIYHRGEQAVTQSFKGYFRAWNDVPYLDLSADYWFLEQMQNISLNVNTQYLLTGDLMISNFSNMNAIFFNRDRWDTIYPTAEKSIYQMVYDGEWTWETYFQAVEDAYQDDGDGVLDEGDWFGTHYESSRTSSYYPYGCGLFYTQRDDEGFPVLNHNNSKTGEMVERLYDFVYEGTHVMEMEQKEVYESFKSGRMLFYTYFLSEGSVIKKEVTFNYGIVPFPKYDSTVDYNTSVAVGAGVYAIPVAVSEDRLGMIGATMEALCSYSSENVLPYYYDFILKANQAGNPEDSGMIDFMREHLNFDPMFWIGQSIGNCNMVFRDVIFTEKSSNFSGYWEGMEVVYDTMLGILIDNYKAAME